MDVRLAVRADRSDLLSLFGSRALACAVGPAEPNGWVAVHLAADVDPGPVAGELSTLFGAPVVVTGIDEDGERLGLQVWRDGAQLAGHQWDPRSGSDLGSADVSRGRAARETAEQAAGALGRSETAADLAGLLSAGDDLDAYGRLKAIVELLGLPERLTDPTPPAAVVLHRGEQALAHTAASIAGPAWLVPLGGGWTLLAPAEGGWQESVALAAGVSCTGSRRVPALLLWRDREECGYVLWHRGGPLDSHTWNFPWDVVAPDIGDAAEFAPAHGDAARLTAAVGRPDAAVLARALLRRRGHPDDLLAELVDVLGLPAQSHRVLAGTVEPGRLPGAQRCEAMSPLRAAWAQSRQPFGDDAPMVLRVLERLWVVGTLLAALVCAALTVLGVAVLATDGAAADQDGISGEDWWSTLLFAALTAVLGWIAVSRLRRLRRVRGDKARGKEAVAPRTRT